MKPRIRPAGIPAGDEDALADFCVLLIDALQVPEVAAAVAVAVAEHAATLDRWPVVPVAHSPVRQSPPARGRRQH